MRKHFFTLLLLSLSLCNPLFAQMRVENFSFIQGQDTSRIAAFVAETEADLPRIRLDNTNFPTVTLPRSIFKKVVDIANRSTQLNSKLTQENQVLRERDTLISRQLNTLTQLRDNQAKQLEMCEKTNEILNNSVKSMSEQVTNARDLAKEANKWSFTKRAWGLLVGGVGGFALGVVLGVVAAK